MPGFDFPSAPTSGQTVSNGNATYRWDSVKWTVAGAASSGVTTWNTRSGNVTMTSGDVTAALTYTPYNATNPSGYQTAAQVTTALAPYAPLASPPLTGNPTAPTVTYGDNDTSIATTAFVQSAVAPSANDTGRNLLHNPTMAVAQRGAGPWNTAGVYTVDRWKIAPGANADTFSFTSVALSDADRAAIGDEAAGQCLQNTFTGNAGAAAFHNIQTPLEFVRQLAGKTVTVSLWAKAASGTPKLGFGMDQSFGSGGSPSVTVSLNGIAVTLSTTWTRYSVTFAIPSVAGKTMGTNGDNSTILSIWFSSGANQATRAGNIGVQSGTIQLWGTQLEIGSVATPLAKREYAEELRLCQRYYFSDGTAFYGYAAAGSGFGYRQPLPVSMRGTPAIAFQSPAYTNASAITATAGVNSFIVTATATAAGACSFSSAYTASADL